LLLLLPFLAALEIFSGKKSLSEKLYVVDIPLEESEEIQDISLRTVVGRDTKRRVGNDEVIQ
jgi:hypothetical protein